MPQCSPSKRVSDADVVICCRMLSWRFKARVRTLGDRAGARRLFASGSHLSSLTLETANALLSPLSSHLRDCCSKMLASRSWED
ncbi:hypothetical protein F4780DRAFT_723731 [Xylariomycetidae sp. FL0641]|nr:hypothetical protein F4780DRAFT_723731 [Xylariomycetidae sp. FL0641]